MENVNISLSYLYEFVYLCKTRNLTETARYFYISPSTLSRHVSDLEKNLGSSLLIRTTHGVELTTAGKITFRELEKITKKYSELQLQTRDVASGKIGELKIASLYYGMEDFVEKYMDPYLRTYPGVDLSLLSLQSNQVLQAVENQECDLGYSMYTDEMDPDKYIFVTTSMERLNIITREELRCSAQEMKQVLLSYTMLNIVKDRYYMNTILQLVKMAGFEIQKREDVEQVDLVSLALKRQHRFLIGPDILKEMTKQKLYFYPIEDVNCCLKMGFYYRKDNPNPCLSTYLKCIFGEEYQNTSSLFEK